MPQLAKESLLRTTSMLHGVLKATLQQRVRRQDSDSVPSGKIPAGRPTL